MLLDDAEVSGRRRRGCRWRRILYRTEVNTVPTRNRRADDVSCLSEVDSFVERGRGGGGGDILRLRRNRSVEGLELRISGEIVASSCSEDIPRGDRFSRLTSPVEENVSGSVEEEVRADGEGVVRHRAVDGDSGDRRSRRVEDVVRYRDILGAVYAGVTCEVEHRPDDLVRLRRALLRLFSRGLPCCR